MKVTFRVYAILFSVLFLCSLTPVLGQIVYKIPDGSLPVDWTKADFKGQIFLDKDSPSGIFIAFPNQGETNDELRERAAKYIAPMVGAKALSFDIKNIPSHKEDIADRGRYYITKGDKSSVQILFFERQTSAGPVLYGYFAQMLNNDKKSKIWVGDDLKDPKRLSNFIKSFGVK